MAIETCENCKRIIGELEQACTWQSHILCKECYARLSNPTTAQSTPPYIHTPVVQTPPKRSLVKSTLIVMATVLVVIVMVYCVLSIIALITISKKIDYARDYWPHEYESAKNIDYERVVTTKANLKFLRDAVNQFKMDTGRFPTEEEGLRALIERPSDVTRYEPGGYLETTEIPKDGWWNDFVYHLSPESFESFIITSYGADGKEGGEGIDADLRSTDPN